MEITWYGSPVWRWVAAVGISVASLIVLRLLRDRLAQALSWLAGRTSNPWDDVLAELLRRRTGILIFVAGVFVGLQALALPEPARAWMRTILLVVLFLHAGLWGNHLLHWTLQRLRPQGDSEPESAAAYAALSLLARIALWTLIVLLILQNGFGIDITALVAGLGLAGVAVALAVQSILSDILASASIVLDRPFLVGDFIIVDDILGTVEHIGLKTTRIRSLTGEQVIVSNADLLRSRIKNYKRMQERRVLFTLGVTYQTPYEKLCKIPAIIKEIIESQPNTRFDRCHFKAYGDFSLLFETVYWVTSPDYNLYMDIQQNINLEIYRRFLEEGIEFAYPTQTVYMIRQELA